MDWMFNNFGGGMPGLRRNASENRPPPPTYTINLRAYPALYIAREDLEPGNKRNSSNVGVLEFTADEGTCILPNWMFETLALDYGAEVNLQLQRSVKRGTYCKLQPHKTEFIDLPDPRAILEKQLSNYVCLTQGDTISIKVLNTFYQLNVLEVKPTSENNCICLIDADVEVDFAAPVDYVEKPPDLVKRSSSVNLDDEDDDDDDEYFTGQGIKINGVKVENTEKKKKVSNDEYDPRKHRLTNGVRTNIMGYEFKGNGVQIGGKVLSISTKPQNQPSQINTLPDVPLVKQSSSNTPKPTITGGITKTSLSKTPSIEKSSVPTLSKQPSIEKPSGTTLNKQPSQGPSISKPGSTQSSYTSSYSSKPGTASTTQKPTTISKPSEDLKDKKDDGIKTINPTIQKPGMGIPKKK